MTLAPLLLSIGISTFVDGPAKPAVVPTTGTVVDERKPAAGAGVYRSNRKAGTFRGGVVAETQTDAQGRFRLRLPGTPGGGPGPGILWAYRPGSPVAGADMWTWDEQGVRLTLRDLDARERQP